MSWVLIFLAKAKVWMYILLIILYCLTEMSADWYMMRIIKE